MGFVFPFYNLIPDLTVKENIEVCEYLGSKSLNIDKLLSDLGLASAVASGRNIILFDEPTSGLDYAHMMQVSGLLKHLKESGKTVIIVTHDIELIKTACTYVIELDKLYTK